MPHGIGGWVRAGELNNTVNNSVQGWLHFREQRHPLLLHLTGNCGRGLRGRRLRFRMDQPPTKRAAAAPRESNCGLQPQQIGPVGRMRFAPSEAPHLGTWCMRLTLEWFSQDGRVIVDLWEPAVEFILSSPKHRRMRPHESSSIVADLLDVDGDELDFCQRACEAVNDSNGESLHASDVAGFSGMDSFADITFQQQDYSRMLDDVASRARDVPLSTLFDPPLRLLPAQQLAERELSKSLRRVLARLARHGIAIDVCPHFSKRQTYSWLLEHILPGEDIYPDLPRLGYVMHYMTSLHCPECLSSSGQGP